MASTTRLIARFASKSALRSTSSAPTVSRTVRPCRRGVVTLQTARPVQPAQQQFWTFNRVMLFVSFSSALAYLVGANDISTLLGGTTKKHDTGSKATFNKAIYANKEELARAVKELRAELGEDAISTDDDDLHRHGFSEWSSVNIETLPVAIAYPRSTKDVVKVVKVCHKYKIPQIPYSGGTSLEANFSAPFGGMSIDFAYMDKVIALHKDDLDVVVQPSVPWMSLNEQIKKDGLFFPVDPGPTAHIGGMASTGCSGTNAMRYGTMRDWVVNLTVVLADGTVIKTRRRPRKSAAGYNLTNLFVGSEGTLGIITEITLKLTVLPQETSVAVVTFPTIKDAAAAAGDIIRTGAPIAACELLDEVQMMVINKAQTTERIWKEVPTLFFKFSGTKAGVHENIDVVKRIAKAHKAGEFEFAKSKEEEASLWSARKQVLWSMLALKEDENSQVWSTDVAVPISRLPELIEVTKADLKELGIFASALGHVGDGNFHTGIMYNKNNPDEYKRVKKCIKNMVDRALEMEGTCTGEHGIGIVKKDYLLQELGVDTINTMKVIKRALDPDLLMNPGKIFDM